MQALPGPESIITCIIQPHGPSGANRYVTVKKQSKLSQIPGLQYRTEMIASLPRSSFWEVRKLTPEQMGRLDVATVFSAVHDPRKLESEDEILESMNIQLYPLHKYCEDRDVVSTRELRAAPQEVQKFLNHPIALPQILKYIKWRQEITEKRRAAAIQIYADEEEQQAMEQCHDRSVEVLKDFLSTIPGRSLLRALDCAGGDGRLSTSFLMKTYQCVDLFDQCPVAVKKAKRAMQGNKAFGYVDQATMQGFEWRFNYSMIFLVWCSGYLTSLQLITFLQKA